MIDLIHKVYMKRCAEAPAMSALLVLLLVILAAAAALLALAYVVSGKLLRPPRRRDEWTPRDLGYEYEEVVVNVEMNTVAWRSSGTPGDSVTASVVLSVAEKALQFTSGLRLMTEHLPFKLKFAV